jgi:glycogen operon protein
MFSGRDRSGGDDIVMVVINAHWEIHDVTLPSLPENLRWNLAVDTGLGDNCILREDRCLPDTEWGMRMSGRSVSVLSARSC